MMEGRQDFDRSWLRTKVDPQEYFSRLLESRLAVRSASFRKEVDEDRKQVLKAWQGGDELLYWRLFIGEGPSGADGLAILRKGEVVCVWTRACIC